MALQKLRFHADQIGSLIRPSALSSLQDEADAGTITCSQLRDGQRAAITAIIDKQLSHGVRALSSGEFDRKYYFSGFFEALAGFHEVSPVPRDLVRSSAPPVAALSKLLRDSVDPALWPDCKFTMPPPCYFHLRLAPGKAYDASVYANDAEFFADLALAYRKEIQTLYDAGLRNLQIDDPTLAYFCSEDMLESFRAEGIDADELFDVYMKAHNDCIADRPADMHVGLHVCRGNFSKSMHFSEGSYEKIAQRFFSTLDYDTFFLEYDSPRAGGFEPLRFLPVGKNVVLGVVTTKHADLEDVHVIKERVMEAAGVIARGQGRSVEQVMANIGVSPQCGFASVAVGAEGMTEEKMFAKLKLVKNIAKDLWPTK
ncbi:hypothetical protein E4U52_005347 [Claviceps spartinae]|nr:hypothetical protein E4U52_005347 [Claviceps spartinae]